MKAENRNITNHRKSGRRADLLAARLRLVQRLLGKYRDKDLLKALIEERARELDI